MLVILFMNHTSICPKLWLNKSCLSIPSHSEFLFNPDWLIFWFHTSKSFKPPSGSLISWHILPQKKTIQRFSYMSWAIAFDLCIFWSNSLKQPSSRINSNFVFLNPFALPLSLSFVSFSFICCLFTQSLFKRAAKYNTPLRGD